MVGNKLFLRSNGHMVPGLSLLQSKSIALNEMVMTWRHCCNWAVGDVFTTMSVTDSAMPKATWLKDSICLAKQVCLLLGSRLFNIEFRIPTWVNFPTGENGQNVAFFIYFLELCCDQMV